MKYVSRSFLILLAIILGAKFFPVAHGFFDQKETNSPVFITIGDFPFLSSLQWDPNKNYEPGDQVIYNGNIYEANFSTIGDVPEGDNVGQLAPWRIIEAEITVGDTTHQFDATVLNATITINGVVVVENGVILTANASSLGLTINKSSGNLYWEFSSGNNRVRIRNNGDISYTGTFPYDSIIFDLS